MHWRRCRCSSCPAARVAASAQERGYLSIDEQGSRHAFSFRGEADRGERVARTIFREGLAARGKRPRCIRRAMHPV